MPIKKPLSFEGVHQFLRTLFAGDLHAKRVLWLAGATLGVIEAAFLAVAMIGQGLSLLCRHGRATPLVWLTVGTATLKDRRNAYEDQALMRLAEVLPAGVWVRIVADRGFGDQKLYRMLTDELRFVSPAVSETPS